MKQQNRIVGGSVADKNEWLALVSKPIAMTFNLIDYLHRPWMAALLRSGNDQFCGGVLVTDQHIMTAAHCVYG